MQQIILLEEKEQDSEEQAASVTVPLVAKNSEIDAADEASSPVDEALLLIVLKIKRLLSNIQSF